VETMESLVADRSNTPPVRRRTSTIIIIRKEKQQGPITLLHDLSEQELSFQISAALEPAGRFALLISIPAQSQSAEKEQSA